MNTPKSSNAFVMFVFANQIVMSLLIAVAFREQWVAMPAWGRLVTGQLLIAFVPCAVIAVANRHRLKELFPFRKISLISFLLIIGICIFIQPFMMMVGHLSSYWFNNNIDGVVSQIHAEGGLYVTLAVIAVVPSVFEELAMRGPALSGYRRTHVVTAAVIGGLFFGMFHFDLQQFAYAALLGGVFAVFTLYTGSLIAPMLGHFVINGSQSLLLASRSLIIQNADEALTQELAAAAEITFAEQLIAIWSLTMFTLPVAVGFFILFIVHNKKRREELLAENGTNEIPAQKPKVFTPELFGAFAIFVVYMGFMLYMESVI